MNPRTAPVPRAWKVLLVGWLSALAPTLAFAIVICATEGGSANTPSALWLTFVSHLGPLAPSLPDLATRPFGEPSGTVLCVAGVLVLIGLGCTCRGVVRRPAWDWLWVLGPLLLGWFWLGWMALLG